MYMLKCTFAIQCVLSCQLTVNCLIVFWSNSETINHQSLDIFAPPTTSHKPFCLAIKTECSISFFPRDIVLILKTVTFAYNYQNTHLHTQFHTFSLLHFKRYHSPVGFSPSVFLCFLFFLKNTMSKA